MTSRWKLGNCRWQRQRPTLLGDAEIHTCMPGDLKSLLQDLNLSLSSLPQWTQKAADRYYWLPCFEVIHWSLTSRRKYFLFFLWWHLLSLFKKKNPTCTWFQNQILNLCRFSFVNCPFCTSAWHTPAQREIIAWSSLIRWPLWLKHINNRLKVDPLCSQRIKSVMKDKCGNKEKWCSACSTSLCWQWSHKWKDVWWKGLQLCLVLRHLWDLVRALQIGNFLIRQLVTGIIMWLIWWNCCRPEVLRTHQVTAG